MYPSMKYLFFKLNFLGLVETVGDKTFKMRDNEKMARKCVSSFCVLNTVMLSFASVFSFSHFINACVMSFCKETTNKQPQNSVHIFDQQTAAQTFGRPCHKAKTKLKTKLQQNVQKRSAMVEIRHHNVTYLCNLIPSQNNRMAKHYLKYATKQDNDKTKGNKTTVDSCYVESLETREISLTRAKI